MCRGYGARMKTTLLALSAATLAVALSACVDINDSDDGLNAGAAAEADVAADAGIDPAADAAPADCGDGVFDVSQG